MSTTFDINEVAEAIKAHNLQKVKELNKNNDLRNYQLYLHRPDTPLFGCDYEDEGFLDNLTLLELAVIVNDLPIVQYLCENCINDKWYEGLDDSENFTTLHCAIVYERLEIAKYLSTQNMFSPFTITNYSPHDSPFTMALRHDAEDLVIYFLEQLKKQIPEKYINKIFRN